MPLPLQKRIFCRYAARYIELPEHAAVSDGQRRGHFEQKQEQLLFPGERSMRAFQPAFSGNEAFSDAQRDGREVFEGDAALHGGAVRQRRGLLRRSTQCRPMSGETGGKSV